MELLKSAGHLLLVAGLTLTGMSAAVVAVNLIPNGRLLSHVDFSISPTNFPPSQFGIGKVDFWDECIAATVGLGNGAEQLSLVKRSFLSPIIGNCEEFQKYKNGEVWIPYNEMSRESGSPTNQGFNYWRYWHGYQVFSRPLLYCFSLSKLRYASFALFLVSGAFFASQVSRLSWTCSWSLLIGSLCVPLVSQIEIIDQSMIWIIAFSIGGWLLLPSTSCAKERRDPYVSFMLLGMLCSFFDIFTVPLITLTVPLLGLYWKGQFDADSPKLTVRRICVLSAIWFAGYSGCWATKWAIVAVVDGPGVVTELSKIIEHRLGIGGGPLGDAGHNLSVSAGWSILLNAKSCWYGVLIVTGLSIARIRPLIARIRPWAAATLSNKKASVSAAASPLLIWGMPIAWLAVVKQHSIQHSWFVARIYFSSFAIVLGFILTPDSDPKNRQRDHEHSASGVSGVDAGPHLFERESLIDTSQ